MKKLLIIEDDAAIAEGLSDLLRQEGFQVEPENDGEAGYLKAKSNHWDLIILDLILPGKNGIDICKDLRNEQINIPILMLTSKKEEIDKIIGLEIGADDYVTKPFSVRELISRVKALLRRVTFDSGEITQYFFGNVKVDFKKFEAIKNSKSLKLSATEFRVLHFFAEHEGEVITRDKFLDEVWGYNSYPTTRTVDNFILSLRKKIEDNPAEPEHLITVHKVGYKFIK